jgi:MFS family permease
MEPVPPATRRAAMAALFVSVGLSSSGYIAAIIVAPLIAEDLLGSTTLSGLPSAFTVIGMAVGSTVLATHMAERGRRSGLILGYSVVAVAALLALVATHVASFALFSIAMFTLGAGHSANRLTRYAASDLYESQHRASAIGWIIWAGTIGSVVGPTLLEPARQFAHWLGTVDTSGAYLVAIAGAVSAAGVLRARMPPLAPSHPATGQPLRRLDVRRLLAVPDTQIAVVSLVIFQGVMMLLMTMTPVHIRGAGDGLGSVGLVIGTHAVGMYALSPLTGYLSDRLGRIPVILIGVALLIGSAFLAANTPGDETARLTVALFLLGLGWNFGFVAGSALLTDSVPEIDRVRAQGSADSLTWLSAAAASLASGVLLGQGGFTLLSTVGAGFAVIPVLVIARHRIRPR